MINRFKKIISIVLTNIKYYNAIKEYGVVIKDSDVGENNQFFKNGLIRKSQFGNHVSIYGNTRITNSLFSGNNKVGIFCGINNCKIGRYSYINDYSTINNLTIGNFCSIGPNFKVGIGIHPINFISTSPAFYTKDSGLGFSFSKENTFASYKDTIIGSDVWIGANVFISEGIVIGDGAIIGSGAVITKDVPPYGIVVGIPGKVMKYRFDELTIAYLLKLRWWEKDDNWLMLNSEFFSQKPNDITKIIFKDDHI